MEELITRSNYDNIKDESLRGNCLYITYLMCEAKTNLYKVAIILRKIKVEGKFLNEGYENFNQFCEQVFGYKKAMTNNLVRIADRFLVEGPKEDGSGEVVTSIFPHSNDYTVSQLQEMLVLDDETALEYDHMGEINPNMTTKAIRSTIKRLQAAEAEAEQEEAEAEQEEAEAEQEEAEAEQEEAEAEQEEAEAEQDFERDVQSVSEALTRLLESGEFRLTKAQKNRITVFKKWIEETAF